MSQGLNGVNPDIRHESLINCERMAAGVFTLQFSSLHLTVRLSISGSLPRFRFGAVARVRYRPLFTIIPSENGHMESTVVFEASADL